MACIAQREAEAVAGVGGHLQPAQGLRIGLAWPPQHRAARPAAQALFEGPGRIAWAGIDHLRLGTDEVFVPRLRNWLRRRHNLGKGAR